MPPDLQMYPTLASPVVPMYNLNGVTNLVLTLEAREGILFGGDGWCAVTFKSLFPCQQRWLRFGLDASGLGTTPTSKPPTQTLPNGASRRTSQPLFLFPSLIKGSAPIDQSPAQNRLLIQWHLAAGLPKKHAMWLNLIPHLLLGGPQVRGFHQ